MRRVPVSELRNNLSKVLNWVLMGEEVELTRRGKSVARFVPVARRRPAKVDWKQSAALKVGRWARVLTAGEGASALAESQGID
jgi:prevent-host-death family protein